MNRQTREKMEYQKKMKKENRIVGTIIISLATLTTILLLNIFDVDLKQVTRDIGEYFSNKKVEVVNKITGMGNGKASEDILKSPKTYGETKKSLDSLNEDIHSEIDKWSSY